MLTIFISGIIVGTLIVVGLLRMTVREEIKGCIVLLISLAILLLWSFIIAPWIILTM
jgi:hypothetical protein